MRKLLDIVNENQLREFAPGDSNGSNGPMDYGNAIIEIGQNYTEMYNNDDDRADAAKIIKVGQTFISSGMAAGIQAFYTLDTFVRDHVAEELMDQGFNVKQDIYQAYSKTQTTQPNNEKQIILSLLKEFAKTLEEPEDRQTVFEIYRAFQQDIAKGFAALYNAYEFDIDSNFTEFANERGVDLNDIAEKYGLMESQLREFAPGDGSGEGRWYTDDQMIDIVGPDWAPEDDAGQLTLGQRLQDAQAWLDDQGYSVIVEDVEIDPEGGYRWKIYGEFYNPRFAEKDRGLPDGYELGDKVTWYYSNHYPKIEGTVVGWKDGKFRIKAVSPLPGQEHTDPTIYAVPKNNIMSHTKKGMSEGQLNENQNSGIVYATGPRKMGTNDVNLIFKNLNTNKIVAWVVGNNDDGGVYEIRINQNGVKKGPPNFVATGNPQDDSDQHLVYKLGKPGTGRMSAIGSVMQNGFDKKNSTYYGQPLEFIGDDDWWSFLENIIGDITWEDDAIDAGYVDRLDNGDLVFVKQNLLKDSLNEFAPTKFVGNFNRGGGGAGRGGDDDRNERDDSDDEGIINKILQALERLRPDPFETYGGEVEDVVVNLVSSGRLDNYIRAVGMGNMSMKELIKQGVVQTLKELKELYGNQGMTESQLNELAPNPGGGDGGGRDDGDDGFELPLDFKGQNIMVWPRNKKHSMGDTATPFPRGERFTGKVYIMWDQPKIEAIWYLDPKDREDREAEYKRVYEPRGWEDYLDHKWYDTTGVRYRLVTDWRLIPAKEPGGWPGIVDAWGQDMKAEVMNYPESFITEIIQKDGDGRHFVEPRQGVAEGSLNEFAPDPGSNGNDDSDDPIGDLALAAARRLQVHEMPRNTAIKAMMTDPELIRQLKILDPDIFHSREEFKGLCVYAIQQVRLEQADDEDGDYDYYYRESRNQNHKKILEQGIAKNDPISMNESLFKVLTRLMIANEQKLSKKRRIR
jgi:hypothetical protein